MPSTWQAADGAKLCVVFNLANQPQAFIYTFCKNPVNILIDDLAILLLQSVVVMCEINYDDGCCKNICCLSKEEWGSLENVQRTSGIKN